MRPNVWSVWCLVGRMCHVLRRVLGENVLSELEFSVLHEEHLSKNFKFVLGGCLEL
jgi:hypothetical protein